jgi:hypothetical protein
LERANALAIAFITSFKQGEHMLKIKDLNKFEANRKPNTCYKQHVNKNLALTPENIIDESNYFINQKRAFINAGGKHGES